MRKSRLFLCSTYLSLFVLLPSVIVSAKELPDVAHKVVFYGNHIDIEPCEGIPWWAGTRVDVHGIRKGSRMEVDFVSESTAAIEKAWDCLDNVLRGEKWERQGEQKKEGAQYTESGVKVFSRHEAYKKR